MKTLDIITDINVRFADTYRNASKFVDSGELWDFCIYIIGNPITISNIVFANDMGVPPVKSLITLYERMKRPSEAFTAVQSQQMGALMGFVFKYVLNYQKQKDRCAVNLLGVKIAARFYDGPVWEFE